MTVMLVFERVGRRFHRGDAEGAENGAETTTASRGDAATRRDDDGAHAKARRGGRWRLVNENTLMRFPRADEPNSNQRSTENREHGSGALGSAAAAAPLREMLRGTYPKPWLCGNLVERVAQGNRSRTRRRRNHAATQRRGERRQTGRKGERNQAKKDQYSLTTPPQTEVQRKFLRAAPTALGSAAAAASLREVLGVNLLKAAAQREKRP